eukprot:TRINITY_DN63680_c0_g1_i1.p1 TRINITY_DN63680_c0_g1~~TRINITY_DN63680_c0_g1_i1.p1  ORF type:complete len:387 (-),score=52.39 TRINITY_DN63680_c0_g1_i1:327-1487(-)
MGCAASAKAAEEWRNRRRPSDDQVKPFEQAEPSRTKARRKSIEELVTETTTARLSFLRNIALAEDDEAFGELDECISTGEVTKVYKFTDTILSRRTRVLIRVVISQNTDRASICRQINIQKHGDTGKLGLKPKQVKQQTLLAVSLNHPNILKVIDVFKTNTTLYEVVELCSGGRLFDSIIDADRHTEREVANFMSQLLNAVDYLHGKMICHRDIKPEHIMFKDRAMLSYCQLKLIDFSTATRVGPGEPMTHRVATPFYASPQVFQERYTDSCDMWACGVVMHLALLGYPRRNRALQKKLAGSELLSYVTKGRFQKQEETDIYLSDGSLSLLDSLLQANESSRITASNAVKDEWLKYQAPQPILSIADGVRLSWNPGECCDRGGMLF